MRSMNRRSARLAAIPLFLTLFACGGSTLESLIPPTIITQPQNVVVGVGSPVAFTVITTGSGLNFQWQKLNGSTWQNISGATGSTYSIAVTVAGDSGSYRVIVSNSGGTATSNAAMLNFSA